MSQIEQSSASPIHIPAATLMAVCPSKVEENHHHTVHAAFSLPDPPWKWKQNTEEGGGGKGYACKLPWGTTLWWTTQPTTAKLVERAELTFDDLFPHDHQQRRRRHEGGGALKGHGINTIVEENCSVLFSFASSESVAFSPASPFMKMFSSIIWLSSPWSLGRQPLICRRLYLSLFVRAQWIQTIK